MVGDCYPFPGERSSLHYACALLGRWVSAFPFLSTHFWSVKTNRKESLRGEGVTEQKTVKESSLQVSNLPCLVWSFLQAHIWQSSWLAYWWWVNTNQLKTLQGPPFRTHAYRMGQKGAVLPNVWTSKMWTVHSTSFLASEKNAGRTKSRFKKWWLVALEQRACNILPKW